MTIKINELVIRAEISKEEREDTSHKERVSGKEGKAQNLMKKITEKDKRER